MIAPTSNASIGRWIPVGIILLLGFGCLAGLEHLYAGFRKPPTWEQIFASIAKDFPSVLQTSTTDLSTRLAAPNPPLLIDCRAPEEFRISHIPGALNLTSVEDIRGATTKPDQEIIVYCSVGVRSSGLAEALNQAGFAKASNLKGSIFQWANEGRELHTRAGVKTTDVHPFNSRWGMLLKGRAE